MQNMICYHQKLKDSYRFKLVSIGFVVEFLEGVAKEKFSGPTMGAKCIRSLYTMCSLIDRIVNKA